MNLVAAVPEEDDDYDSQPNGWVLKSLKPKHRQIASLIAQGMKYVNIADLMQVTPQYVSMLSRQPLIQQFVGQICEAAGLRLEALTDQTVEVIAATLRDGSESGKLKAARLQLEATKRIGPRAVTPQSGEEAVDRLERLAQKLLYLQGGHRPPGLYSENGQSIQEAEFRPLSSGPESAQEAGNGQVNPFDED